MSEFFPVIIPAGGLGTRLGAKYADLPKSLVPVNGEPFVAHQLKLLAKQGVKDVIFCLGYHWQQIQAFVGDGSRFGLRVRYSLDGDERLGTGGAVQKAISLVQSDFGVIYGDSYLEVSLSPLKDAFRQSGKPAMMTVYHNRGHLIESNILLRDNQIEKYEKADSNNKARSSHKAGASNKVSSSNKGRMEHVDFGLSMYSPDAFTAFAGKKSFDLAEVIQSLIAQGQLAAYEVPNRFYEVGTQAAIDELASHLKSCPI